MYFDLSKPQKLLQQAAREFCKRECPTTRVHELLDAKDGVDSELWQGIADQGWVGLHLAEEFEGLGLGLVELAVVAEELGRACAPGPWLSTNWASTTLALANTTQAKTVLPQVVDGTSQITLAILEEEHSWEISAETKATVDPERNQLSGTKQCVMNAAEADWILCVANLSGKLCLVSVPSDAQGVQITSTPGIDATRKLHQCDFNQVTLDTDDILAKGDAAKSALQISEHIAIVAVCAEMLGLMQHMLEMTVEYAKTRRQFDRVIGSFQAIQHMCADMLLLTESARSAVWYAAWSLDNEEADAQRAVTVAKIYTSDAVRQVGNLAVQVHGGIGFTWEHDLHLYYKRAKATEYLLGDATFHREQLARMTFDESCGI